MRTSEARSAPVDFLIDDYDNLSALPIDVKSGKDYYVHRALNTFLENADYHANYGIVFSNAGEIRFVNRVLYAPVYNVMFL